ncbi:MAG: hypothetical protein EXQ81_11755 [Thermoleophilia bacterium]|nr:hypothetical protein [Thermoleophilia bacterium]
MRTAVLATLGAVGIALMSGTPGQATDSSLTWKVEPSPFRITVYKNGAVLVRERVGVPGAGARLSYRIRESGAFHSLTTLISQQSSSSGTTYSVSTTEPNRTATVTVARTATGLRVGLDLGTGTTNVRTIYEAFDSAASEHFLGTGERQGFVDLRGRIVPIKVWHDCGSAKPAPFFLSSRGYGVRFATANVGRMGFGTAHEDPTCQLGTSPCEIESNVAVVQACFKTDSLAYEIYAGTPDQIVRSYAARTGKPPMPEVRQFALTKWRDRIYDEAELIEDADRFAAARIPLGWLIVDNPWEANQCSGSMRFEPRLFPTPERTMANLHERGISVMMWVSPAVRAFCAGGLYPENRVYGDGAYRAIDLTDPTVVSAFEQRLRDLLATGIDGFKVDRGDEVDFETRTLANASGNDIHNTYPILVAGAIDRAARAVRGTSVPTLFRVGFSGSQRIATGTWSGDLAGDWTGLANAVRSAQTAGLVGHSTWGSDVGGYLSSPTADVFVRWSQLGAVSPVFEVGGVGANATPWTLGDAAMNGLRTAAILHYELFPYHYELARQATATGISILRPLALQYPADERAWAADRELLVGPDLLAAPVTRPGSVADVYLPKGRWVDLGTGVARQGPATLRRPTPLAELPLYLREGAAIPFNLREPAIWADDWGLNDQFRTGRGGWLVAPGGQAVSGSSVEYGSIKGASIGSTTKLQLTRARRETQVVVLDRRLPARVTIDGKPIARSSSAAALRRAKQGWLVRPAPTGGIVLKLAPRGGRSGVSLEY